jgi:hypothetical protein
MRAEETLVNVVGERLTLVAFNDVTARFTSDACVKYDVPLTRLERTGDGTLREVRL